MQGYVNSEILIPILRNAVNKPLRRGQEAQIKENFLRFILQIIEKRSSLEEIVNLQNSNSQLFLITFLTNQIFNSNFKDTNGRQIDRNSMLENTKSAENAFNQTGKIFGTFPMPNNKIFICFVAYSELILAANYFPFFWIGHTPFLRLFNSKK